MTGASRLRAAAALALATLAGACGGGDRRSQAAQNRGPGNRDALVFPVEVERVQSRPVEYAVSAVGSVEAFERVEVTARVGGAVEKVGFQEGMTVDPARALAEIEPERYRLAVRSAKANVEKAEAARAEAETGLRRREAVNQKNPALVKEEDLDTWRTRVRTAAAEVAQAKSGLDLAELNLREAFVRAPFPGIIQTRSVQTGQYVQPGAVIATLVRREPLLLRFQVPEQDAASIKPGLPARFTVGESSRRWSARITHVAAAAEAATRMVAVTARVDDPERAALRPGAFAQVTVPVGGTAAAPVVPETAVRPSERGFLGFVVEGEVARERVLTLGLRTADGRIEVRSGVRHGEILVVRGGEALQNGARVRVEAKRNVPKAAPGPEPGRQGDSP